MRGDVLALGDDADDPCKAVLNVNIMNINVHDNIFNVKVKSQEIDVVNVEPREANNAYNRAPHLCK